MHMQVLTLTTQWACWGDHQYINCNRLAMHAAVMHVATAYDPPPDIPAGTRGRRHRLRPGNVGLVFCHADSFTSVERSSV